MHVKMWKKRVENTAIWFCAIYSFFFSTAAKFLRSESAKCPARAVSAKSRARHVHVMSLNLLTSRKSPLIQPLKCYTFVLPSENQNAFCLLSICANAVYNVMQSLKDISSINFFSKDIHESLKYVDELSELKKMTKFKKNTHLSLSLSLLVDL